MKPPFSTLCFGGSFNPIHHGHLICARAAAESAGFERILLIPSAQPPHKPDSVDLATPEQRLEMCRLAVSDSGSDKASPPRFEVDDLELRRRGPSYTLETVRALRKRGWPSVHWLIGADMLRFLPQWHEPETLLEEAILVVMARPGWVFDWRTLPPPFRRLESAVVETPLIDISASDIRQRIKTGRPIDYLTPPAVCRYIENEKLYRRQSGP